MMSVCLTQRDIRERFVCQSVCPWLSVCDVSIKGRKLHHEVNVWSLPDIAISNLCLGGSLYFDHRNIYRESIDRSFFSHERPAKSICTHFKNQTLTQLFYTPGVPNIFVLLSNVYLWSIFIGCICTYSPLKIFSYLLWIMLETRKTKLSCT